MGACCSTGTETLPACWTSASASDTPKPPHVDESKLEELDVHNSRLSEAEEIEELKVVPNPETEQPKPELEQAKPDFNGTWLLTDTDDMEKLLIENGVAWTMRRFAKSMKYGVGTQRQAVRQCGNEFIIENKGGLKNFTTQFIVDGPEIASKSPDGQDVMLTASWESGNRVILVTMKKRDGSCAGSLRRYFDGEKLIMETISKQGTVAKRFFTREK